MSSQSLSSTITSVETKTTSINNDSPTSADLLSNSYAGKDIIGIPIELDDELEDDITDDMPLATAKKRIIKRRKLIDSTED